MQAFAGHLREMLLLHRERRFIQIFHIEILKDVGTGNVAEKGDLVFYRLIKRVLAAADYYVGAYSHALKILYACLRRFGF